MKSLQHDVGLFGSATAPAGRQQWPPVHVAGALQSCVFVHVPHLYWTDPIAQ